MFTLYDLTITPRLHMPFSWHHMLAFPRDKCVPLLICIIHVTPYCFPHTANHCSGLHHTGQYKEEKCQRWKHVPFRLCASSGTCTPKTIMAARLTTLATVPSEPLCYECNGWGQGSYWGYKVAYEVLDPPFRYRVAPSFLWSMLYPAVPRRGSSTKACCCSWAFIFS